MVRISYNFHTVRSKKKNNIFRENDVWSRKTCTQKRDDRHTVLSAIKIKINHFDPSLFRTKVQLLQFRDN